jgi:hypothetical protein
MKWQLDETNLLVFVVLYYLELQSKKSDSLEESDWNFMGDLLLRAGKDCEIKWSSLMKSRSNKKSWTVEEDQLLTKIIK